MTIRRAAAAMAVVIVFVLSPATGARASSPDPEIITRQREVVIHGHDGLQHTCYLDFNLLEAPNKQSEDSAQAWTLSDSQANSSPPGAGSDPACADATVEATLYFTTNGAEYVHTGRRSGPYPDHPAAFAAVYVYGQSELAVSGDDTGFSRLSSTHRVYFPSCDCSFTETLVLRK